MSNETKIDYTTTFAFSLSTDIDPSTDPIYVELLEKVIGATMEIRNKYPDRDLALEHCPYVIAAESERI